ncbi:MAG TPA: hypothetical protein VMH36_21425 [Alphaproteobacteria bacterium]|nr:hypothetical protein [Alphaproteobacteria bacterium]
MRRLALRLIEDRLPGGGDPVYLPALNRAIYIVEGEATVELPTGCCHQAGGSGWLGETAVGLLPGASGVRLVRWELAPSAAADGTLRAAPQARSETKLTREIELEPGFGWLMRCDRVSFPKGGIAYTHVHQGPGIRYCLEGRIHIETEGRSHSYGPGEAWFEIGHEPVLAPTSDEMETSFVRCFILPRACRGRSSIRYVRPEDATKPKTQRYRVLGERFIELDPD